MWVSRGLHGVLGIYSIEGLGRTPLNYNQTSASQLSKLEPAHADTLTTHCALSPTLEGAVTHTYPPQQALLRQS